MDLRDFEHLIVDISQCVYSSFKLLVFGGEPIRKSDAVLTIYDISI